MAKKSEAKLPLTVEILPGTAKRGYELELGAGGYGLSVGRVISKALASEAPNRTLESIQEKLRKEYGRTARITINGKRAEKDEKLEKYLAKAKTEKAEGKSYKLLQVRVAKPGEGGYSFF